MLAAQTVLWMSALSALMGCGYLGLWAGVSGGQQWSVYPPRRKLAPAVTQLLAASWATAPGHALCNSCGEREPKVYR